MANGEGEHVFVLGDAAGRREADLSEGDFAEVPQGVDVTDACPQPAKDGLDEVTIVEHFLRELKAPRLLASRRRDVAHRRTQPMARVERLALATTVVKACVCI